jgi:hypothetical protein
MCSTEATMTKRPRSPRRGGSANPKHEILAMGYDPKTGIVRCEVSEPLFLATHSHPYAISASDHQLFLQISRTWLKDLLYCADYSYGCIHGDGGLISPMPTASSDAITCCDTEPNSLYTVSTTVAITVSLTVRNKYTNRYLTVMAPLPSPLRLGLGVTVSCASSKAASSAL